MIMIFKLINRVFDHSGPIASLLINAFNCRLTMIIGGIFIFIGCALTYFAHSLNVALITYGIIAGKRFFPRTYCVGMNCKVYMYMHVPG